MANEIVVARFQKNKISLARGWPEDQKFLTILVGASSGASVSLHAFGLVEIARLDTSSFTPQGANAEILKVSLLIYFQ